MNDGSRTWTCPDWFQTFTGAKFYPTAPRAEEITIQDIAHALSNLCRFGGHLPVFFSVAQHSVIVSHNVPRELALYGLLHDASEAYLLDMPRNLKQSPLMAGYRVLEQRMDRAVAERFGWPHPHPQHHVIKIADRRSLATERRDLRGQLSDSFVREDERVEPFPERIIPASPRLAENEFLQRYVELRGTYAP